MSARKRTRGQITRVSSQEDSDDKYSSLELKKALEYGLKLTKNNKKLKMRIERLKKRKSDLKQENLHLSNLYCDEMEKKNEQILKNDLLEQKIAELQKDLKEAKTEIGILKKKNSKSTTSDAEFSIRNELYNENKTLQEQVGSLQKEVTQKVSENEFFQKRVSHLKENVDSLNKMIAEIEVDKEKLLKDYLHQKNVINMENKGLRDDLSFAEKRIISLTKKVNEQKNIIDDMDFTNNELKQKVSDLTISLKSRSEQKKNSHKKENSSMKEEDSSLYSELEKCFTQGLNNRQIFFRIVEKFQKNLQILNQTMISKAKDNDDDDEGNMMEDHFNLLVLSVKQLIAKEKPFCDSLEILWCIDTSDIYENALKDGITIELWWEYVKKKISERFYEDLKSLNEF